MTPYLTALSARVFAMASSLVCGLVALRLYRHLAPEAYGVVLVALTLIGYLPLLDGGFRTTLNRMLLTESRAEERRKLLRFGQVFYSWLGLGVCLLALILMTGYAYTARGRESGQSLAFFMSLGLGGALAVVSSIQAGVLVGLQAQASFFLINALSSWVNLGALWLVLTRGGGVWAFPISTLCSVLCVYPLAIFLIRQREPEVRLFGFQRDPDFWRAFRGLRSDAWHCFRSQVSIVVLYTIDILLVGFLCSAADAAIYGVLSRIFAILRGFLQSMSEISWPMIAQRGSGNQQLNHLLNRMNAWAVGSVTGALCFTLAPFCGWYLTASWMPEEHWVWLMAARFMVTSLAAPAAYLLYGTGDFRAISRYLERELLAGCILAVVLGPLFGVAGIAGAFLLSTGLGTLFPIFQAYVKRTGDSLPATLFETWTRAAAGLTISILCTKLALGLLEGGSQLVLAGAVGCAAGLAACFTWSAVRMLRAGTTTAPTTLLRFMNCI